MITVSPLAAPYDDTPRNVSDQKWPALRIVVHVTGRSTYNNAETHEVPPLVWLGRYFDKRGSPFAHYGIDPWGRIMCYAPETERPWAQGWGKYRGREGLRRRLRNGSLVVPAWWKQTWGRNRTPLDLIRKDCSSPNDRSVAIEMVQYGNQVLLTVAQYTALGFLVRDISVRHGIPLPSPERMTADDAVPTLLGHEDVDPWGRGTPEQGGWDPGARRPQGDKRFAWTTVLTLESLWAPRRYSCILDTPPKPDWAD